MSIRYTKAEFEAAGILPLRLCDGNVYTLPDGTEFWFACDYHQGYIDGFNAKGEE